MQKEQFREAALFVSEAKTNGFWISFNGEAGPKETCAVEWRKNFKNDDFRIEVLVGNVIVQPHVDTLLL